MPVIKILLLYEKENAELFVNCHVVSGEGRGEVGKGLPSFSLPVFAYFLETVMLNPHVLYNLLSAYLCFMQLWF